MGTVDLMLWVDVDGGVGSLAGLREEGGGRRGGWMEILMGADERDEWMVGN